jgi:hypothetical protein
MAKLIVPTKAVAKRGERWSDAKSTLVPGKLGKFHLEHHAHIDEGYSTIFWTACGLTLHTESDLIEAAIEDLNPEQLCGKCLGAMKVVVS